MTRLALLAVLLLALAPAFGRVLAAGAPQVLAGWSQLCTSGGLKHLPSAARNADGMPVPAGIDDGADCPYCPLAASLALPPLLQAAAATSPTTASPAPRTAPRRRFPRLHGPGSRGPPILR